MLRCEKTAENVGKNESNNYTCTSFESVCEIQMPRANERKLDFKVWGYKETSIGVSSTGNKTLWWSKWQSWKADWNTTMSHKCLQQQYSRCCDIKWKRNKVLKGKLLGKNIFVVIYICESHESVHIITKNKFLNGKLLGSWGVYNFLT